MSEPVVLGSAARSRSRPRVGFLAWMVHPARLMVWPVVAVLLFVTVYPFLYGLKLSLYAVTIQNYFTAAFVGLANYAAALVNPNFWHSMWVTLIYVVVAVGVELVVGFYLAVLMHRPLRLKRLWIALIIAPMMVPPVLVGVSFVLQLNSLYGPIPFYLQSWFGFVHSLLGNTYALPTLIAIDIWQWTPFMFLLIYAGLQALPPEVLEAATVDGAHGATLLKNIVVPLVAPVMAVALIFRVLDAFKSFDTMFVLTNGGPNYATTTISIYIFKLAFATGNFGEAAAINVLLIILVTIIVRLLIHRTLSQVYES